MTAPPNTVVAAPSGGVPVLTRAANAAARWSARWVPNSFVIACLLTLVTFAMVIAWPARILSRPQGYWVKGFWELLELTMQMSLIVLTGYVVAVSPACRGCSSSLPVWRRATAARWR